MSNYKVIVSKLNELLSLTSEIFTENQIDSVSSLINAGEWNLSIETLCDLLYEEELPITKQAYELLKELGLILNMEKSNWEILEPQIVPDYSQLKEV